MLLQTTESGYRGLKTHGSQGKARTAGYRYARTVTSPLRGLSLGCRGFSTR